MSEKIWARHVKFGAPAEHTADDGENGAKLSSWLEWIIATPRRIGRFLLDQAQDLNVIEERLENACCSRSALGAELASQARARAGGGAPLFQRRQAPLASSRRAALTFVCRLSRRASPPSPPAPGARAAFRALSRA